MPTAARKQCDYPGCQSEPADTNGSPTPFITSKDNTRRGPGLWRFNNSYLDDPEFKEIVLNIIKMQTQIHAKNSMSNEQWDELSIEDYQNIDLAENVDPRIFFDCLLAGLKELASNMVLIKSVYKIRKKKI